jgi:hypothetical protein
MTAAALLLFERRPEDRAETEVIRRATAEHKREQRLFCALCRHPVTAETERIAVGGAHTHTFTNPHGLSFRIGCFREAAGCRCHDPATLDFTWFAGYAWRVALCARCHAHLGWSYSGDDGGFYGLIVERLASAGPSD